MARWLQRENGLPECNRNPPSGVYSYVLSIVLSLLLRDSHLTSQYSSEGIQSPTYVLGISALNILATSIFTTNIFAAELIRHKTILL